jgi:hypothetical protein
LNALWDRIHKEFLQERNKDKQDAIS